MTCWPTPPRGPTRSWSASRWSPRRTPGPRSLTWSPPGLTRPCAPSADRPALPGRVCLVDMTSPPARPPAEPDIAPVPDRAGHFGEFGGLFAPESLMAALEQLAKEYEAARHDPRFRAELDELLRDYASRPTRVTEAKRFGAEHAGGCRVLLKREDLAHTGSHKINNVLGQVLLTKRMGKARVIAETGAGQHGV